MISDLIKKLFGDKSQKDQKNYQPYIDACLTHEAKISSLTDDELRGKTLEFKTKVIQGTADLEKELAALKEQANDPSIPIYDKEALYENIDSYTKKIDEKN